jgi:hypothetical protein
MQQQQQIINQLHTRLGQRKWWWSQWQHIDDDNDGNGHRGAVVVAEYQQWVHSCVDGMIIWRHKYPRITIFVVGTLYSD